MMIIKTFRICVRQQLFKCYYLGQSVMMQKSFYDQYYTIGICVYEM